MAAFVLNVPEKIDLSGDSELAWRTFKQKFDHYMLAAGYRDRPDEEKVALLLNLGGDQLLEVYNSLEFPAPENNDSDPANVFSNVLAKLDAHFTVKKTLVMNRYKFRKCRQQSGESVEAFILRLRVLAKDCDFKAEREDCLLDQLVFGCQDNVLREKFFREEELTLAVAEKIAIVHQAIFQDGMQKCARRV